MKKIISAALLMAPIAAGAVSIQQGFTSEIADQCTAVWPDSGHMRARCIHEQTDAAIAIIRAYRAASAHQRHVIATCLGDWRQAPITADESYDYAGARNCVAWQVARHDR